MKKAILFLFVLIGISQAHAVSTCVATVPKSCEIVNSQILTTAGNSIFALSIDCKERDGSLTKLVASTKLQGVMGQLIGAGIENLPVVTKIQNRSDDNQNTTLNCR